MILAPHQELIHAVRQDNSVLFAPEKKRDPIAGKLLSVAMFKNIFPRAEVSGDIGTDFLMHGRKIVIRSHITQLRFCPTRATFVVPVQKVKSVDILVFSYCTKDLSSVHFYGWIDSRSIQNPIRFRKAFSEGQGGKYTYKTDSFEVFHDDLYPFETKGTDPWSKNKS